MEGGKRILPEENVALGDRGSEQEASRPALGRVSERRVRVRGHFAWGVGVGGWGTTKRISLAGAVAGQRLKGMSQCGNAGDARVGQTENFRRWALLY